MMSFIECFNPLSDNHQWKITQAVRKKFSLISVFHRLDLRAFFPSSISSQKKSGTWISWEKPLKCNPPLLSKFGTCGLQLLTRAYTRLVHSSHAYSLFNWRTTVTMVCCSSSSQPVNAYQMCLPELWGQFSPFLLFS